MNDWEDRPLLAALIIAAVVAGICYLGLIIAALLDRVVAIWILGAIFGVTFVIVLVIEIVTSAVKPPSPPQEPDEPE